MGACVFGDGGTLASFLVITDKSATTAATPSNDWAWEPNLHINAGIHRKVSD
jgi:hypothetical protein